MSKERAQSPLFVKTYDYLLWLIPQTLKFPRSQRFLLAERLSRLALEFYDQILEATMEPGTRAQMLRQADKTLTRLRLYTRLSYDLHCLNMGKFEHSARQLDEIGRLLGGWQRATKGQ
jgi:hypothetical protein